MFYLSGTSCFSVPARDLEFNHVIIYVSNAKRSLDFYEKLLGFRLIEESEGYARLLSPRGRTTIALHETEDDTPPSKGRRIVLYFEVRDLDKTCKQLVRNGLRFSKMPKLMPWGWRHAYLNDPDGHEISLYWAGRKRFKKTL
jgi:catechol 2,3-dioxygenase